MKNKAMLFGGALLAAGLTAPQAVGDFAMGSQPDGNYIGAFSGGFIGFDINGFYNYNDTSGTSYAKAEATALSIVGYSYGGDTGLAYTIHFLAVPFEVTTDATATVSWDFTGDGDGIGGGLIDTFLSISDSGGNIFFADLNTPVGSTTLSLTAGEQYSFFGTTIATSGVTEWSIVIPAPAALPLLAAGGLLTTRRRRRQ